jgi:8-oxo-dGTP pyrophosphatase MutT (NUDIX family)
MLREISSGGVVLRRRGRSWGIAVIEPQREAVAGRKETMLLALPKGLVDPGETAEQTALREVREETGLTASVIAKLADIKYVYVRSWGDKQRVFKIVSFYLLRYKSGRIDDVSSAMRVEVKRARWPWIARRMSCPIAAKEMSCRRRKTICGATQIPS